MARTGSASRGGRTPRQRVRELVTFALAFVFAFFVGRSVIQLLGNPPTLVQLAIFFVLYAFAYVGIWRLGSTRIPRPNSPR